MALTATVNNNDRRVPGIVSWKIPSLLGFSSHVYCSSSYGSLRSEHALSQISPRRNTAHSLLEPSAGRTFCTASIPGEVLSHPVLTLPHWAQDSFPATEGEEF